MKTTRFASMVADCGEPEAHLVLMDPAKDRALQAAVKAHRVMTVLLSDAGHPTDRGEVGFKPGPARQFLIFPKSLKKFEGRNVVGIKYDLLTSPEIPRSQRAAPAVAPKKSKPKEPKAKSIPPKKGKPAPHRHKQKNIVAFKPEDEDEVESAEESNEVAAIKQQVRHAMKVLEAGKAVAAFNLMKRIVER